MSKDKKKSSFLSLFGKRENNNSKEEKTIKTANEKQPSDDNENESTHPSISKITVHDVNGRLEIKRAENNSDDDGDFENDRQNTIVMSKSQKSDSKDKREKSAKKTKRTDSQKRKKPEIFADKHEGTAKKGKKTPKEKLPKSNNDAKVTDIRQIRKQKKQKKRIKKIVVIGILAVFGVSVYVTKNLWVPKLEGILDRPHDTIVNDGKTEKGNFPIQLGDSSVNSITHIDNSMIKVDDNHIVLYNENGTAAETFNHNYADPVVQVAEKRILVYDLGGNSFEVLNKKNQIYEKKIDKPIVMAAIAQNSNVAVVTQTEKYSGNITVYNENGSEIYTWSSGQRILDVQFTKNGDGCYISTFDSVGGQMKSVIHKISFNSTEEVMKSKTLDTLALDISVNDSGDYWIVGDSKFYRLDKDGSVLLEYEYPGEMVSFDAGESSAAIAFKGVQRSSGMVAIFKSESDKNEPDNVLYTNGGLPKKLAVEGKKIILLSAKTIDAYDISGNLLATAAVSSEYTDFTFFNENVYFMGCREINKIVFKT